MTQTISRTFPPQLFAATATKRLPTAEELPYSDGEPLETYWHTVQIWLLISLTQSHWSGRKDFFCGGNMFMYFCEEHIFNNDFRGPDYFLVKGVDHEPLRLSWVSWEEGDRLPDLIIELLAPSTKELDRTVKKKLYDETFQTFEYFCFDPDDQTIEGWRRDMGGYRPIEPDENGRLWSTELEVSFDWWTRMFLGRRWTMVRMFDADGNLVPTFAETADAECAEILANVARAQDAESEVERLRKEIDALRQQLNQPKS